MRTAGGTKLVYEYTGSAVGGNNPSGVQVSYVVENYMYLSKNWWTSRNEKYVY